MPKLQIYRNNPDSLITQSSGCPSGVDNFRNLKKIKKSEHLNSQVSFKL